MLLYLALQVLGVERRLAQADGRTQITWLGQGGILLLCGAGGGLLAGMLGSRSRHRKGGRRVRPARKAEKARL